MTHEVQVTRKTIVTKKELYKFLGWIKEVREVGDLTKDIPLKNSSFSAIVDTENKPVHYRSEEDNVVCEFTVTYKDNVNN
jgi:hypothetical protein